MKAERIQRQLKDQFFKELVRLVLDAIRQAFEQAIGRKRDREADRDVNRTFPELR